MSVLTTLDKAGRRFGDDTDRGRHYRHKGKEFISVTTALEHGTGAAWAAPAAAKYTANFVADNWRTVNERARTEASGAEFRRWLKTRYQVEWDAAMNFGSEVHDAIEWEILNDAVGKGIYEGELAKRMRQFHDFVHQHDVEFEVAEVVVVNETIGYAGTLDAIVLLPGDDGISEVPTMIDYKTGKAVYADAAVQLAAYAKAEYMIVGDQELPIPEVDYAAVLHLLPRSWKLIPVDIEKAWPYVEPIVKAAQFHTEARDDVIYKPLLQGAWLRRGA